MVFRDLFKKVKDEVDKRTLGQQPQRREQEGQRSQNEGEEGQYQCLAAWIKTRHGNRFRDGQTTSEVEAQLQNILKELEAKGQFQKHPKIANGFRAYISQRKYGDLVKASQ
jgi:hypothetical protein